MGNDSHGRYTREVESRKGIEHDWVLVCVSSGVACCVHALVGETRAEKRAVAVVGAVNVVLEWVLVGVQRWSVCCVRSANDDGVHQEATAIMAQRTAGVVQQQGLRSKRFRGRVGRCGPHDVW